MNQTECNSEKLKKIARMSIREIHTEFGIKAAGHLEKEAVMSQKKYGTNKLTHKKHDSMVYCLRRAFVNPFAMILFVLGIITFFTDVFFANDYQKNPTSAIIIFTMLIISGIVRLTQEMKAKNVADTLTMMVETSVQVLRSGSWVELPASDVVVGDQIRLEAGDRVPADIRIVEARDFFVSQSTITGESGIFEKTAEGVSTELRTFADYTNILFGGTTITGGTATGIVIAVGKDTVYGGLNLAVAERNQGFDKGANSIAGVMVKFMVILVPVVFLACGITKGNWPQAFLFALSVAVGLTPELLPMVVNACLAKGSYSMGKKQTIVKNINAMQSFGSMDILCVDKTGTLTGDQIVLEYYMDILGNESQKTLDYAYLASYYHTGVANHLESAIRKVETIPGREAYYRKLVENHPKVDERPFDYSRRFSSVLVKTDREPLMIIKGSVDDVIGRCRYIEYDGKTLEMSSNPLANVHMVVDEMLEDGMKVLAVAYKPCSGGISSVDEATNFILLGYLAFFDAPKNSAKSAIEKLNALNIRVKVLTGDDSLVAESVCRRLRIDTGSIITGPELEVLPENEIPMAVERCNVFTQLSPKQKAYIVEMLQSNGHTVGFLGDGMNDLSAVLQADVGISVENATDAVKESANVILLKKDLNILEEGVLEGRKAFANMTKYIKITASSNFGNICAIVIASVLLPFFPMSSIQILLLNLLYDILCLILPWDQVDSEMLERPLEWSGKKLSGFMIFFGPLSSLFDLLTFAVLYFIICPSICGGSFLQLMPEKQALFIAMFQTGWFLESMWTQVLILQLLRTEKIPFIQSKPGKQVLVVTLLGILLYTLLPISVFGRVLGLCKMPGGYYVFLISVVVGYLLLVSVAKAVFIHKKGNLI